MIKKRQQVLRSEHEQMAAALQTIERGTQLAEQLKTQLGHEKMVLEQKKEVCSHRMEIQLEISLFRSFCHRFCDFTLQLNIMKVGQF